LTVIKPLLVELETFSETLDEQEFVESVIALLERGTVADKAIILDFNRQWRSSVIEPSFTPQISEKTKKLASKALKRDAKNFNMDLNDQVLRFAIQDEVSKLNLELKRQQLADEEIKECSFHPVRSIPRF
jgi:hypothetical protein